MHQGQFVHRRCFFRICKRTTAFSGKIRIPPAFKHKTEEGSATLGSAIASSMTTSAFAPIYQVDERLLCIIEVGKTRGGGVMARFYFDCFDGEQLLRDEHGIDLAGLHEVADDATELIGRLLADNLHLVPAINVFVSVRGEDGMAVYCGHGGFVGRYTDHALILDPSLNVKPHPVAS